MSETLAFVMREPVDAAERIDVLEGALHRIVDWADAYPLDEFPEPDWDNVRSLLGDSTLSAVSASNMRHVVKGVGDIARKALDVASD